jgi:hypothetical protein
MSVQNYPGAVLAQPWISGLVVSNDATTPNTKLDISAGICRDSNNIMDMTVGVSNKDFEGGYVAAPLVLNTAVVGANGIDTGTLAASTLYAVYLIGDSTYQRTTASLMSLASNSLPLMPAGYDSYRLIGYASTDGSTHFRLFRTSGTGSVRTVIYNAPVATAVTAGASATYAAVALTTLVPPVNDTLVKVQTIFTPNAANDKLNMQGYLATGDQVTVNAQVAAVAIDNIDDVQAQLNVAAPSISYKVSAGAVAINVAGYTFYI